MIILKPCPERDPLGSWGYRGRAERVPEGIFILYKQHSLLRKTTRKELSGGPPLNPVVLASEGWVEALLKVSAEHHAVSRLLSFFWALAAVLGLWQPLLGYSCPSRCPCYGEAKAPETWPFPVCSRLTVFLPWACTTMCRVFFPLLHPFQRNLPPLAPLAS